MISPSLSQFQALASQGNLIPVYRELTADLDTPVSAFLKVASEQPYAFLLESVQGGAKWGRYSMIGLEPFALFTVQDRQVEIHHTQDNTTQILHDCNPMQALKQFMSRFKIVEVPELPRFHGGAVGYFAYDMVRCFEQIPNKNPHALGTPDAQFMLTDLTLIFDNQLAKLKVVVNVFVNENDSLETLYQQAVTRINAVAKRLQGPYPQMPVSPTDSKEPNFNQETSKEAFEAVVKKAKEYILAGDIFQVVLSHRLSIDFPYPPIALYRALRATNPSPYLYFVRLGEMTIVGSSPEILVRQEGETATVRPIAGTRRRGANATEDLALEQELLADPKELAE
ncbi:MAG: chorismate-binding protein, partial [Magnetococcales bacterium]|nr:chorismate-binding protein [Magnetococcales bacterium]